MVNSENQFLMTKRHLDSFQNGSESNSQNVVMLFLTNSEWFRMKNVMTERRFRLHWEWKHQNQYFIRRLGFFNVTTIKYIKLSSLSSLFRQAVFFRLLPEYNINKSYNLDKSSSPYVPRIAQVTFFIFNEIMACVMVNLKLYFRFKNCGEFTTFAFPSISFFRWYVLVQDIAIKLWDVWGEVFMLINIFNIISSTVFKNLGDRHWLDTRSV